LVKLKTKHPQTAARGSSSAQDLSAAILTANAALRSVKAVARRVGLPGAGHFERWLATQMASLAKVAGHLDAEGRLNQRGVGCTNRKKRKLKINARRGGRPRRTALIKAMRASTRSMDEAVPKIRRAPARLLRYARQRFGSDAKAVEWLLTRQPEFGGNVPLFADLRLQRRIGRSLLDKQARDMASSTSP
jgi:hypothetical protein